MSAYADAQVNVRVEQAVARGETLDEICTNLRVTPTLVDKIMRRMDAAAGINDDEGDGVA